MAQFLLGLAAGARNALPRHIGRGCVSKGVRACRLVPQALGEPMSLLLIRIGLELTTPVEPEVRAWVDLHPDAALASEVELPLQRSSGSVWSARLLTAPNASGYFLYRIGLAAHPGAVWSITVQDGATQSQLLTDGDVAPLTKCWLVGTCPFRVARSHPKNGMRATQSEGGRADRRHSGVLVLLRGGKLPDLREQH